MSTSFTAILERAVERIPGAVGAIFAAVDGEAVDQVGALTKDDLLIMAAHYGVILNQVKSALGVFHFGEAFQLVLQHDRMDLILRSVGEGYYVVVAAREVHLATALREVRVAANELRQEMG